MYKITVNGKNIAIGPSMHATLSGANATIDDASKRTISLLIQTSELGYDSKKEAELKGKGLTMPINCLFSTEIGLENIKAQITSVTVSSSIKGTTYTFTGISLEGLPLKITYSSNTNSILFTCALLGLTDEPLRGIQADSSK